MWPIFDFSLRKSFLCQPKALGVVKEYFDRSSFFIAEDEECPRKWILLKDFSALSYQAINTESEIYRNSLD